MRRKQLLIEPIIMATQKMNGDPVRLEDFFFLISKKRRKKGEKKEQPPVKFHRCASCRKGKQRQEKRKRILMKNIIRK